MHLPSTSSRASSVPPGCALAKTAMQGRGGPHTVRSLTSPILFGSSGYLKCLINWRWIQLLRMKAFACECCSVTMDLGGRGRAQHTHKLPRSPELAQWPLFPLSQLEHKPSTGESLDSISMPICFLYSTPPKGWTWLWWTHFSQMQHWCLKSYILMPVFFSYNHCYC